LQWGIADAAKLIWLTIDNTYNPIPKHMVDTGNKIILGDRRVAIK